MGEYGSLVRDARKSWIRRNVTCTPRVPLSPLRLPQRVLRRSALGVTRFRPGLAPAAATVHRRCAPSSLLLGFDEQVVRARALVTLLTPVFRRGWEGWTRGVRTYGTLRVDVRRGRLDTQRGYHGYRRGGTHRANTTTRHRPHSSRRTIGVRVHQVLGLALATTLGCFGVFRGHPHNGYPHTIRGFVSNKSTNTFLMRQIAVRTLAKKSGATGI